MYLKSVEKVVTLGKLIGLLFIFCLPLLYFIFKNTYNKRNDLARPVMGTIFLVINQCRSMSAVSVWTRLLENLEKQRRRRGNDWRLLVLLLLRLDS